MSDTGSHALSNCATKVLMELAEFLSAHFIQFAQCFGNESIGLTVRSLRTLPYPAKLPQYYLSYIGLAKERPGDEPSCFYRMPDSSGSYMAAFA